MDQVYVHRDELTTKQYAAIGYFVRSLSCLEHALGVAALDVLAQDQPLDLESPSEAMMKIGKATFGKRLSLFMMHYRNRHGVDNWSTDAEDGIGDLGRWRDGVCHGIWDFLDEDTMRLTFFDRPSAEGKTGIPEQLITFRALLELANAANYWSNILATKPWRQK